MTARTRHELEERRQLSGRTLSAETEIAIELGLHAERALSSILVEGYGRRSAGLLKLIGQIMRQTDTPAGAIEHPEDWPDDPVVFARIRYKIKRLLDHAAPPVADELVVDEGAKEEVDDLLRLITMSGTMTPVEFGQVWVILELLGPRIVARIRTSLFALLTRATS
jgi:hypothetical protein